MRLKIQNTLVPTSLQELEDILVENRKISDRAVFFNPPHPDSFTAEQVGISSEHLKKAKECISTAVQAGKKIVIFGDYDADGICATATVWSCIHAAGGNVFPFIPDRHTHGYGLTVRGIDDLIEQYQPDLIITVDNGIVAHDALQYAADKGIEVIVSDHHQKEVAEDGSELPILAHAVVHTTELCGTTVAWMLGREIHAAAAGESLDLCALATLADQVPLRDSNRAFAFHGLRALRTTTRAGLLALLGLARLEQATLSEQDVSFGLAPRINAMGRVSHGLDALRLLCTKQQTTAEKLAQKLHNTNVERQDLTKDQYEEALLQVSTQTAEHVLIVHSTSFHEGVIGLIAGKLTEKFHKPSIVMAVREAVAKGSARSVNGINITNLLRSVRSELLEVGGHPMAGGFSVALEKIESFKKQLQALALSEVTAESLVKELAVECAVPESLCTVDAAACIEQFAPFGAANIRPLFLFEPLEIVSVTALGKEQKHAKFLLVGESGTALTALWWGAGEKVSQFSSGELVQCVGQIAVNEWRGKKTVQLILKDLQTQESV